MFVGSADKKGEQLQAINSIHFPEGFASNMFTQV